MGKVALCSRDLPGLTRVPEQPPASHTHDREIPAPESHFGDAQVPQDHRSSSASLPSQCSVVGLRELATGHVGDFHTTEVWQTGQIRVFLFFPERGLTVQPHATARREDSKDETI